MLIAFKYVILLWKILAQTRTHFANAALTDALSVLVLRLTSSPYEYNLIKVMATTILPQRRRKTNEDKAKNRVSLVRIIKDSPEDGVQCDSKHFAGGPKGWLP